MSSTLRENMLEKRRVDTEDNAGPETQLWTQMKKPMVVGLETREKTPKAVKTAHK